MLNIASLSFLRSVCLLVLISACLLHVVEANKGSSGPEILCKSFS